jgi:2-polyprenyl-3-methyl-5-hydroxy-6-metoxy-1,4-benzoquinol methylase
MTALEIRPDMIDTAETDAFVERLFGSVLAAMDLQAVYLGDRFGYYRALADWPLDSTELAARTGTAERYVREWLEQQAVAGILEATADADPGARRFTLPAGHDEVLLDANSLNCFAPVVRFVVGALPMTSRLLEAFRTGDGIPWSAYGADVIEGQAGQNRAVFLTLLGQEWLPAIADVHARLLADPPARVADIACGGGWSSIGIARAYPKVHVDGFDLDESSIVLARENVKATGLGDRVTMAVRDAGDPSLGGRYDLVTIFESLHDMSRPVEVLAKARALLAPGGAVLVMDERVAETFTAPADLVERLMYGFSVLCCLPVGLADRPSAATGTVMRPATLRRYAEEAGLRRVEILPIEHDIFRFYQLRP